MVQKCCVFGCPSPFDVPSHKFPSDPELLDRWRNSIKLFRKNMTSLEDFKKFRICHLHFADEDYKSGGYARRILRDNVVPSLNLPVFNDSDDSENDIDVTIPIQAEPDNIYVYEDTEPVWKCERVSNFRSITCRSADSEYELIIFTL